MVKLIDEFRRGWQGISQPSPLFSIGFAASLPCAVDRGAVGSFADPAGRVLHPVFSGRVLCHRVRRLPDRNRDGACRRARSASPSISATRRPISQGWRCWSIYLIVCGLTIWGIEHYRSIASQQREISKRLIQEEEYRKLVVDELQHRLKNKLSTIHAVLHQVLQDQPQIWASIDQRMRALSATDDLIARVDGSGCDIKDLLLSELGPYGHVRFTLNGDPLFLPAKLAVSLALIFPRACHQCREIRRVFLPARAVAGVVVGVRRSPQHHLGRDRRSRGRQRSAQAGFGTKLLKSALRPFDGKTEIAFLKTGVHCTMQCRVSRDRALLRSACRVSGRRVDVLLMTIAARRIANSHACARPPFSRAPLNQNYKRLCQSRRPCKAATTSTCRSPRTTASASPPTDTELEHSERCLQNAARRRHGSGRARPLSCW